MAETLRKAHTGEAVGEGHLVTYRSPQRAGEVICYVDSWSCGERVVWLRPTPERVPGARIYLARPDQIGLYIGFQGDAQP